MAIDRKKNAQGKIHLGLKGLGKMGKNFLRGGAELGGRAISVVSELPAKLARPPKGGK